MRYLPFIRAGLLLAAASLPFAPAFAASAQVEEASALLKQMHADQCAKQKLQGPLLNAHRYHDQKVLDELGPQLDAINQRLKPALDKLKALKAEIQKNQADKLAFEDAQMSMGNCE